MRGGFSVTLIVVLLFAGGYFYNFAQAVCAIPLKYRVGELDERFDLTLDEAKVAIAAATEVWEEATGKNLFTYDENADFTINFAYDERQALVEEEVTFTNQLESAKDINDALTATYDSLVADYNALKATYENKVVAYEQHFKNYNQTVDSYNESGGAPPEVFDELEAEKAALEAERRELNSLSSQLNALVMEINSIGEKGNSLIEDYNEDVGDFNNRFGQSREFTQGDYRGDHINIYTFKDQWELETVLAHELGHALSLDHVEGEESIMHYLMGDQPLTPSLSSPDLMEFNRVCGEMSIWDKIVYRLDISQK